MSCRLVGGGHATLVYVAQQTLWYGWCRNLAFGSGIESETPNYTQSTSCSIFVSFSRGDLTPRFASPRPTSSSFTPELQSFSPMSENVLNIFRFLYVA